MVEITLQTQLSSLAETAESLNHLSNTINASLHTVEKRLVDMNVGLEVWLEDYVLSADDATLSHDPIHGEVTSQRVRHLGFAKVNGKWGLAVKDSLVKSGYFENDGHSWGRGSFFAESPIPLAQASREERIRALGALPTLIERLEKKAEAAITTIKAATQILCE